MSGGVVQPSLRELLIVLLKRKWSLLALLLVTNICGLGWLFFIRDDGYEVVGKVLVRLGREQAPPITTLGLPPMVVSYRHQDVNVELEILQSTVLLAKVVDHLGLDKPGPPPPVPAGLVRRIRYEVKAVAKRVKDWSEELLIRIGLRERLNDREAAIYMIRKGLAFAAPKDSSVVAVGLVLGFREGASIVLNTLLDLYLDHRQSVYSEQTAADFFEERLRQAGDQLSNAEKEAERFENGSQITALERQKEVLLSQIATAEQTVQSALIAYEDLRDKSARLAGEAGKPEPNFARVGSFEGNSFPNNLLLQLADLQRERERLRLTNLDQAPQIRNNRSQFDAILSMLNANLQSALAEREAVYKSRLQELNLLRGRLDALHSREPEWSQMKRRVRTAEEDYLFYRRKVAEASTSARLTAKEITNVVIIERATDPLVPVGTRKLTLLGVIAGFSLMVALAWAAAAEFFDHGIHSHEALDRHLEVPVVAVIPSVRKRAWESWLARGSGGSGPKEGSHAGLG